MSAPIRPLVLVPAWLLPDERVVAVREHGAIVQLIDDPPWNFEAVAAPGRAMERDYRHTELCQTFKEAERVLRETVPCACEVCKEDGGWYDGRSAV